LTPPPGGDLIDLLVRSDPYINQGMVPGVTTTTGVPVDVRDGWRLTVDVSVPAGAIDLPVLVYFHGGAWTMGSPASHRRLAADLAALGVMVLNVDYRRAPKHRFPGPVEDGRRVVAWALEEAARFGGDPRQLLIGGDSAGANIAAAVATVEGAHRVHGALLLYGIYDYHRALPSLAGLFGGSNAASQPYVAPADFEATRDNALLSPERVAAQLPPTLLLVGDDDPLLAESTLLAERLEHAGIPHTLHVAAGAPHGFLQFPGTADHAAALRAIATFLADLPGVTPRTGVHV
jgi:acetyl esterase